MPISESIETRSSVAMLPVAPAGTGTPPQLAKARLEAAHAHLQGGKHVGEALTARVVKVSGELGPGGAAGAERLEGAAEELSHLDRIGDPGRVPEADLLRARIVQPARDVEHPLDGHAALVWAAEGG